MGRLTRAIIVATLTVALIAAYAAATVSVNTPTGDLFIGATYYITWTVTGTPPTALGIINIHSVDNNKVTVIDDKVNFTVTVQQKEWVVNVPVGNYYFGINDGGGEKSSAQFKVIDRNSTSGTTGNSPSPTDTAAGTTTAAGTGTAGNTGTAGTTPAGTTGAPSPTNKSGAATLQYNLLSLFVGLGLVASVMVQLF